MNPEVLYDRLGIEASTPELYDALGIPMNGHPSQVTTDAIKAHYHAVKPQLASNMPKDELQHFETAFKILSDPAHKKIYDEHIFPTYMSPEVGAIAERTATQALGKTAEKLSIRNPVVMMGVAVAAIGSALMGLNATKRLSKARDEGAPPSSSDRAQQALGFSGAAGVIGLATMMWNVSGRGRQ